MFIAPPLQLHLDSFAEDKAGESNRSSICLTVANTVMVSSTDVNAVQNYSFVVSRTTSLKDSSISREATQV